MTGYKLCQCNNFTVLKITQKPNGAYWILNHLVKAILQLTASITCLSVLVFPRSCPPSYIIFCIYLSSSKTFFYVHRLPMRKLQQRDQCAGLCPKYRLQPSWGQHPRDLEICQKAYRVPSRFDLLISLQNKLQRHTEKENAYHIAHNHHHHYLRQK